ncbi:MAG: dTDP-4-dehydrorhamnose reductase [Clostridia bacterium]|nr:dTDP-4-dehydrorhamnose reductase [Clostridia bacterium]
MKLFVTGVGGQLGYDVTIELTRRGHSCCCSDILTQAPDGLQCLGCDYVPLDITDAEAVQRTFAEIRPDAVIHCAAWTAVDAAEDNREKVMAINHHGTAHLAAACRELDAKMLYISTDYVFNGDGTEPWEPECTAYAPVNVYGDSKLQGELAVKQLVKKYFIVRTAWVFGENGNNFVKTMLRLGQTHPQLRVVNDQIGTPTYTPDLARLIADMIETEKYGIYHATNAGGYISWYEFACEIFKAAGCPTKVIPVTTEEYGLSKARRPFNSRLDKSKLIAMGFTPLPDWKDALTRYLSVILNQKEGQICQM